MSQKLKREDKRHRPTAGQVEFRLLCITQAAGGLIGHSGNVIKRLERETSCRIHVDLAVSSAAKERLVHVIGSYALDRTLHLDDGYAVAASAAQEALVRVFERMLEAEVEGGCGGGVGGGGAVKCCLLVGQGMVGAVMGKGGERISKVVQQTKAVIRILTAETLPPCADPSDELIQITGDSLAVKKALVIVSTHLQQKTMEVERGVNEPTSSGVLGPGLDMMRSNGSVNGAVNRAVVKVAFKLLCPHRAAGAVIGTKGRKVKVLEEETGAAICFLAAEAGCYERVVTVSAMECRESQDSRAQNAIIRVFNEIVSSEGRDPVTFRLLVFPNQCDWLNDGEDSIILAIQKHTGATLQVLDLGYAPVGANGDEKVIQIDGKHPNVQGALFQITCKLRERIFDSPVAKTSLPPPPHKIFNVPHYQNDISRLTGEMNNCRVSEDVNGSCSSTFSSSQLDNGHSLTNTTGSSNDSATAKNGSDVRGSVTVTKTIVEISVREDVFGGVYGDNGSNLTRLRLISGATVEVHDPSPGSEGKVIVSGTRDQTLVAQSLLQAFIMSAK